MSLNAERKHLEIPCRPREPANEHLLYLQFKYFVALILLQSVLLTDNE